MPMTRLLLVEMADSTPLAHALAARGVEVSRLASSKYSAEVLKEETFDAVLVALAKDLTAGAEICRQIAASRPEVALIATVSTTLMGSSGVVLAAGADDVLSAPSAIEEVTSSLERALARRAYAPPQSTNRRKDSVNASLGELIGQSPAMQDVYSIIQRVARSDATVMITGETGTGKELAARTLHAESERPGAFVPVNCASLPETLLESELFGHAKGAFTDAKSARPGLFALARGGTIFLDELAETSLSLQAKLLRALQERTLRPVGSDHELPFDARAVVATNRDLDAEILAGRFRADLYYRIQVIQIALPPLRERGADVLLLGQHFLDHYAARTPFPVRTLTPSCSNRLLSYPWPGNVRELQNCMERAVALGGREIDLDDLPERIRRHRSTPLQSTPLDSLLTLAELERRHIREVLSVVGGKKSEAARILGIDRKTLYRRVSQYGLDQPRTGTFPTRGSR